MKAPIATWSKRFVASDPSALVGYSQRVVYLSDHQMCVLTPEDWKVLDVDSHQVSA